jgi:serine/threonine-protein kinase
MDSRYELLVKIASGGMATVYVGRVRGAVGFWRLVAIKRAHPHLLADPIFSKMLIDEARLASRIHHPNAVAVLDVEELGDELLLVMDYVEGAALSELLKKTTPETPLPARIAVRVMLDACAGLQAAHELTDEHGEPLGIIHRDISPHNILVGADGVTRLTDFGIAKLTKSPSATSIGALKGKLGYMAPEYVESGVLDQRSDVFGMGIVLWESLASKRLFRGENELETIQLMASSEVPALGSAAPWVGPGLDDVMESALARLPDQRFQSARAFANALETAARRLDLIGSHAEVAAYVKEAVRSTLDARRAAIRAKTDVVADGAKPGPSLEVPVTGSGSVPAQTSPARLETVRSTPSIAPADATLDGSGISSTSATRQLRRQGRPSGRSGLRTAAMAIGVGGLIAIGFATLRGPLLGSKTKASEPLSPVPAEQSASVAHSSEVVPAGAASSAPTASASASSSASAPLHGAVTPPKSTPKQLGNGSGVAPNPYHP